MKQENFSDDLLRKLTALTHLPKAARANLAKNIEKVCQNTHEFQGDQLKLFDRLLFLLEFSREPMREDTRKFLDKCTQDLFTCLSALEHASDPKHAIQDALSTMELQSKDFFEWMLIRYRIDLRKLREKEKLLKSNLVAGLSLSIQALYRKFPRSRMILSAQEQFLTFQQFLQEAESAFSAFPSQDLLAQWKSFRVACRKYELAKVFSLRLSDPVQMETIDLQYQSILPPSNPQQRLRQAYTSIRYSELHAHHFAQESMDSLLIQGEAQYFYERVAKAKPSSLPKIIHIVEWNAQETKTAAAFLDHILFLDLEAKAHHSKKSQGLYPRLRYHLCVSSNFLLEEFKKNRSLTKHPCLLLYQIEDPNDLPLWKEGIFYLRALQFLSEKTSSALFYLDQNGKAYELQGSLCMPKESIIRSADYAGADKEKFYQRICTKEPTDFSGYHPDTLGAVSMDYRLSPVSMKQFAFEKSIMKATNGDLLYPLHDEGLRILHQLCKRLSKKGGFAHIFDYGIRDFHQAVHQQYYYASQLSRRFAGVGIGNDLCFPILGLWARGQELKSTILLQESLVEKMMGKTMVDAAPFIPHYSRRKLIRHVSVRQGMFRLEYLKHHAAILQESQGTGEKSFYSFIERLQTKGYLGRGGFFTFHRTAKNHLENLAFELDFWINGIFVALVGKEYFRWIPLENELIQEALEEIGYDSARIFRNLQGNPHYGASWVLRLER